jgi:hypothetical protein
MTTIVQVEFRESLLSIRDEILQSLGHLRRMLDAIRSRRQRLRVQPIMPHAAGRVKELPRAGGVAGRFGRST